MERLRRDGGCRALADSAIVGHLPLLDNPENPPSSIGWNPDELAAVYEQASARNRSAVVAICEAEHEGDLVRFVRRLDALGRWLADRLQHDRTPFPLAACVIAAHGPIAGDDREALETLLSAAKTGGEQTSDPESPTFGLSVIVPTAIPVYAMVHRTRLDHESRGWSCQDIWPAAVARLLASIWIEPRRTAGLRAWRSVSVNYTEGDARALEREVIEIVREAVDSVDDDADAPRLAATDDRMKPESPPSERVDDGGSPRHRLDKHGSSRGPHEPVPGFWAIEPIFEGGAGGGEAHCKSRLDTAPETPWRSRFFERGRRFIGDRFKRAVEVFRSSSGPRSVLRRVWRGIHDRHDHLRWYADGGFFTIAGRRELESLSKQVYEWQEIRQLDADRDQAIACASAEARELDRARSHFVGIAWRVACAASSGLFAAAIVGSVTAMLEPKWTLYTGIGAGVAAASTGLLLLITEAAAGARGRNRLEREAGGAESAISRSYAARLELSATGELLHRSTAWIQNCARVRDAAKRLLSLWKISLEHASGIGIARSVGAGAPIRSWSASSMVEVAAGLSFDDAARACREEQPDLLPDLRDGFESFWSESMRQVDPHEVGDVVARRFGKSLEAQLRTMRDDVRGKVVAVVERWVGDGWIAQVGDRVVEVFGPGTEFAGLSVSTRKASGADLRRIIRAHASNERVCGRLGDSLRIATLDGSAVSQVMGDLEPWGCVGLAIEEIEVSLPLDRRRPVGVFIEGPQPPEVLRPSGDAPPPVEGAA